MNLFTLFRIKAMNLSSIDTSNRTSNLNIQIVLSFIFKITAVGCNFLLVPVTLKYLGQEQYGVWMTILSVLSWIAFFDLGLGNGMRNKVSEVLADNRIFVARQYISSTYISVGVLVLLAYLLLLIFSCKLNWQHLFNAYSIENNQLNNTVLLSAFVLFLNFVLSLINQVINAYQMSSLAAVNQLVANALALILTYILALIIQSSIFMVAFCYGFSLILSNLIISWNFYSKHSEIRPSVYFFRWDKVKDITGLSVKFFIIQFTAMVFFAKDNIIIIQILGPTYVTIYAILFKLFSIVTFVHSIILGPLWSAFTDAYVKGDFLWINKTMKKLHIIMMFICMFVVCLCLLSPVIFHYWLGTDYGELERSLVWLMGLYVVISAWNNTYATFLNGTGKLKLSFYLTPFLAVVNILLSIYMTKLYGLKGLLMATMICMLPAVFIQPIQYGVIVEKIKVGNRTLSHLFCS